MSRYISNSHVCEIHGLADTARTNPDSDLAAEQLSIVVGKLARQGCLLPVESGRPGKGENVRAWIHTGIPCKGAQATRKF